MVECNEFVAEIIVVLRDFYLIAFTFRPYTWKTRPCVRLPLTMLIPHVLRLRYFPQVLDVVVEAVAVDMVYLHRRKTPVVPSPDDMVREEIIFTAIDG